MTGEADNKDEWLDYRDAAKLMRRPKDYFHVRNADGTYKYYPEIGRWRPGGYRTRLYVRRAHVEEWIERSRTPPTVKQTFSGIGYESALPTLRRLGADRVIRSLGLERHIQGKSKPTAGRKAKKGGAK